MMLRLGLSLVKSLFEPFDGLVDHATRKIGNQLIVEAATPHSQASSG